MVISLSLTWVVMILIFENNAFFSSTPLLDTKCYSENLWTEPKAAQNPYEKREHTIKREYCKCNALDRHIT